VRRFSLATPTGTVEVSPASDPELFWATAGGMGLTGVVTEATLSLLPVETSWMSVDTERFDDLDGVMAAMESGDDGYRYSVAWVDCMTRGARLGRGVLTRGEHATAKELPAAKAGSALTAPGSPRLKIPRPAPRGCSTERASRRSTRPGSVVHRATAWASSTPSLPSSTPSTA